MRLAGAYSIVAGQRFVTGSFFNAIKTKKRKWGTLTVQMFMRMISTAPSTPETAKADTILSVLRQKIIKKLLLTKNFMLQYVFLDIAYDILESTDWGITKASVSLSNNERFDLMFTFVIRTLSYGRSLPRKAGKTFLHI